MSGKEKGFAARWSKRKISARQEEQQEEEENPENDELSSEVQNLENPDNPTSDALVQDSEEELLTEKDFEDVDFETLDKSSDYTRFVKANVPAAIQKKALRKLWESDSVFEVLDGMNDYDEDFTGDGLAGKVFKTAYKIGQGFVEKDDDELAEQSTALPEEELSKEDTENKLDETVTTADTLPKTNKENAEKSAV